MVFAVDNYLEFDCYPLMIIYFVTKTLSYRVILNVRFFLNKPRIHVVMETGI